MIYLIPFSLPCLPGFTKADYFLGTMKLLDSYL